MNLFSQTEQLSCNTLIPVEIPFFSRGYMIIILVLILATFKALARSFMTLFTHTPAIHSRIL